MKGSSNVVLSNESYQSRVYDIGRCTRIAYSNARRYVQFNLRTLLIIPPLQVVDNASFVPQLFVSTFVREFWAACICGRSVCPL